MNDFIEVYARIIGFFSGAMIFVLLGLVVLMIVAWCFIFKKAGEAPGKLFIPVYGQYLMYKIADCGALFIANIVVGVAGSIIISIIGTAGTETYYYGYYSGSYLTDGARIGIS